MALSNQDEAIIRDYLLGKLDDEDQQKIEERLMLEDELFEKFEMSKGELVEEYVAGELPPKDHEWFRTHFLASPEGREQHAFVLAMDKLCDPPPVPQIIQKKTWWERFLSVLMNHRRWTIGLTASATAAIIIAAAFLMRPGETVVGPTLIGTLMTRAEGPQPARVKVSPDASKLRLHLLVPQNSIPATRYRADLDDRLNITPVKVVNYDAEGVVVEIPAKQIPPGEYSLQLFAIKADGTEERVLRYYLFNVER